MFRGKNIHHRKLLVLVAVIVFGAITAGWWMTEESKHPPEAEKPNQEITKNDYKLALKPTLFWEGEGPSLHLEALLVHGEKASGNWTFEVNGNKQVFKKEEIEKRRKDGYSRIGSFSAYRYSTFYRHDLKDKPKTGQTYHIRVQFQGEVDGERVDLTTEDRVTVPGMSLRMNCKANTLTAELTHAKDALGNWNVTTYPLNPPEWDEGESEVQRKSGLKKGIRHTVKLEPGFDVNVKMQGKIDGIPLVVQANTQYKDCPSQNPVKVTQTRLKEPIRHLRYRLSETGSGVQVTAWMNTDHSVEGMWILGFNGKENVRNVFHTFSKKKITTVIPTETPGHYKVAISFVGMTPNGRIINESTVGDIRIDP
ncbi:hypothetical protein C8P63_1394 [Melghirimyces profundicolus]|uniref:Uncharacterized protein n=1 Tax=Melghirimyces profundicolus TaxID=1242148 RepID=A0A2T6B154_9BACL|nr:hypothetical protein [Melghirimyces profundicolus]PTX49809.1 hypothetical protein C8P63_1394 [Melghirimyces profundicolus]